MKKKTLRIIMILFFLITFSAFSNQYMVKAEDIKTVNQIRIVQNPSKVTYTSEEEIDTTGMVVECTYTDGTSSIITDYEITGYDLTQIGSQVVTVSYQNVQATFQITVNPSKVTNVSVSHHNTSTVTLTWDYMEGITNYEVYLLDETTGAYVLANTVADNSVTFNYNPGTIKSYQVRAITDISGVKYVGEVSDSYKAATNPEKVNNLVAEKSTTNTVKITWDTVTGATGYYIYRYNSTTAKYEKCGSTKTTSYTNKGLGSGKGYAYKVRAYTLNSTYLGQLSTGVKISTYPAKVILKSKAGEEKIRFTWTKVTGASAYDIYMDNGAGYTLVTTNKGNSNCSYLVEDLNIGNTYNFYAIAHREFNGVNYNSQKSKIVSVTLEEVEDTSTNAKYFPTKEDFIRSSAYTYISFLKNNLNYSKSIVIPGIVNTKVDGFASYTMCPQGIAFANGYLLITAYDTTREENSVMYVVNKTSKELLATITLPTKAHLGGVAFDGTNVWVTIGTRVSAVALSQIDSAVVSGIRYINLDFITTANVNITASYLTFYNDKLWVGAYNELSETYMHSYTISNKDILPELTHSNTIKMPTRVQGISFTKNGYLILSRSCQLYKGLRGYMRQLDLYKPDMSNEVESTITIGKSLNTVEMPSMNEGIAIDGSYLYVNFESGAFDKASYKMDRICAFKLISILDTKKEEKNK